MADKFLVSNAPFLRSSEHGKSTKVIMRDLMISLLPVILFAIYKNVIKVFIEVPGISFYQGIYPLLLIIISPIFSMLIEALCLYIMKKNEIKSFKDLVVEVKNGFGMFPGLFIVLISPVYIRLWELLVSIAVGEVIGKMVFGGFGQNIFNPALIGRAFMAFAFTNDLGSSVFDPSLSSYLNAYEALEFSVPSAGASVLTNLQGLDFSTMTLDQILSYNGNSYSFLDMFLGFIPGTIGETSAAAILVGCIYLVVRKVIDWRIPVFYVLTVAVNTFVIGLFAPECSAFSYTLFQVLSGGLMFGAVYMATEPVTSPKTHLGRIMYALMLGVLTVLFRLVGNNPEGVATAIVTMNIFGLVINKFAVLLKVDGKVDKKEAFGLVIFGVIFLLFFTYNVLMVTGLMGA